MAASLKKYIEDPSGQISKKIAKISTKCHRKIKLAKEMLAGNYTSKTIDLDWDNKPTRIDLINRLIQEMGYKDYLEIGCRGDDCFRDILVPNKIGVDPNSGGTHRMTSDEFFAQNKQTFDLIFIDGLHTYEQVLKDILNAAEVLKDNGTIIMHDCLPLSCKAQFDFILINAWNGDVWKAFVEARTMTNLDAACCLIDHGVGVIKKRQNSNPLQLNTANFKTLKYSMLADDYERLLNTMDFEQAVAFATKP